jgi:chemotaxis protein CheZ
MRATIMAPSYEELFQHLGQITRQLHDSMGQLGVVLALRDRAEGLSDARSRLQYIARKTGESADKVLTAVEQAKREGNQLLGEARRRLAEQPDDAFAARVEDALTGIDAQLTDIMLAQDFHDLTGQVVARVVSLAADLEDNLVRLLVRSAPAEQARAPAGGSSTLDGPVIDPGERTDVVRDQGEVDELLATLGF